MALLIVSFHSKDLEQNWNGGDERVAGAVDHKADAAGGVQLTEGSPGPVSPASETEVCTRIKN